MNHNVLVIDTETTGMEPEKDQIVEIAGCWSNGPNFPNPTQPRFWDSLCNPEQEIPAQAMAVHHISDEMVKDKPVAADAWKKLLSVAGGQSPNILAAHNMKFDYGFMLPIAPELANWRKICTWRCAMHLWPDAPGHSNQVLRYWLKLDPWMTGGLYPHRALYDTFVTYALLLRMLEIKQVDELVELTDQPVLLDTIRFGKYKGSKWSVVPHDYLEWLLRQSEIDGDVEYTSKHYLGRLKLVNVPHVPSQGRLI